MDISIKFQLNHPLKQIHTLKQGPAFKQQIESGGFDMLHDLSKCITNSKCVTNLNSQYPQACCRPCSCRTGVPEDQSVAGRKVFYFHFLFFFLLSNFFSSKGNLLEVLLIPNAFPSLLCHSLHLEVLQIFNITSVYFPNQVLFISFHLVATEDDFQDLNKL